MGAIRDKIEDMREDLEGMGVASALRDQLSLLEQELIVARDIRSAYSSEDGDLISSKLEGYRLALKILEDALIFEV